MAHETKKPDGVGAPEQTPTALTTWKNRRAEPRHAIDASATIRLIDISKLVHGRIVNVSLGGCCIHTNQRFPLGIFRRVEIEFCAHGLPFRLGGVTQGIHDPCKVGIRFLNVSARKRDQLTQLIGEIKVLREREGGKS